MADTVRVSVCYSREQEIIDIIELAYNTVWSDLEEMFKARLDCSRVSVTYMDSDNDEVSIGSQEELFEAFREAMRNDDRLSLNVLPLTSETAVFRMPDIDDSQDTDPPEQTIDRHEEPVTPKDRTVAIPLPDVKIDVNTANEANLVDETEGTNVDQIDEVQAVAHIQEEKLSTTIVFPDSNEQLVVNTEGCQWENLPGEMVEGRDPSLTSLDHKDRCDQLLQYSDFVTFMTKLKKDLRLEIVRDVTRKTVKQVLKGLDGAVIESLQGITGSPTGSPGAEARVQPVSPPTSIPAPTMAQTHKTESEHPVYIHDGVFCDGCNQVIIGPRYKCGNCVDFDLCEYCENKTGSHNPDHVFVKIRRPCLRVGVSEGVRRPLLKASIYRSPRKCNLLVPIPSEETVMENEMNVKLEGKMRSKIKGEKKKKKDERKMEKLKRKEEKLKRRIEGTNDSPLKKEKLDLLEDSNNVRYDFYKVMMAAKFLSDLTMPDNTPVQPETKFVKSWWVKNEGDGAWSESTKLKLVWGHIPAPHTEVDVPHLQPGEEGALSVDFVSPSQPGEYESHWKLHENGMWFGNRVWCVITVMPREILEPTKHDVDPLKLVMATSQKSEPETVVKTEVSENIEITFREAEEEHLREVAVIRDEKKAESDTPSLSTPGATYQSIETGTSPESSFLVTSQKQEVVEDCGKVAEDINVVTIMKVEVAEDSGKLEAEHAGNAAEDCGNGKQGRESDTEDGFVVYAKHGEEDVVEVEKKESDSTQSIAEDLSLAVAQLTLESEKRQVGPAASYTPTPNNTPFDVTPLKTPNPEPEDETLCEDTFVMKPLSSSSSVELVDHADTEDLQTDHTYVRQRMESLELKPDIDLESVSSYSDDDEDSSLSDSDYIIVPLPDCFDLNKPLRDMTISSYSNSLADGRESDFSLDDNHNAVSPRSIRALSVDDLLYTSDNCIPTRPLSPTPARDTPPMAISPTQSMEALPTSSDGLVESTNGCEEQFELTNGSEAKGEHCDVNGNESTCPEKTEEVMVVSTSQFGAVSCAPGETSEGKTNTVASLDTSLPLEGATAAGAAAADAPNITSNEEGGIESPITGEPVSASAQMPANVRYVKINTKTGQASGTTASNKSVDFAPEFANQLVATAVNAAGQAYITAKAVFKTWQDRQDAKQGGAGSGAKPRKSRSHGKGESKSHGHHSNKAWKPASTQWTPPEEEFTPPQSEWTPPKEDFKPPKSEWKPPTAVFTPPVSTWKPPTMENTPEVPQWTPPEEENEQTTTKEPLPLPKAKQWTPPKEEGPMGKLFEMGFYDRDLNRKLLNRLNNDLGKVIQELLSMKNADWAV